MRMSLAILLLAGGPSRGEIRDVLKSAEIDAMFARTGKSLDVQVQPNYAVVFRVNSGRPGEWEEHPDADEVWFVRRGAARLWLGRKPGHRYHAGAGDVVHVPRGTAYQIAPGEGRFEYVVARVLPAEGRAPRAGLLAARRMPDVLPKSDIDATFARAEQNQPLHAAPNFTVNYVIYKGHRGPWEAHRGCVDIYFLHTGTARAQLGGRIANPKEETPGEIRGTGVSGAREYDIGPGDIVLIPRGTAHHMDPGAGKLGYLLLKVWAD